MKKELGKWLMDVAKYLLTAVVVASLVSDLTEVKWLVYVLGVFSTAACLVAVLLLIKESRQKEG